MQIFVVLHGTRVLIDVENTSKVSELKKLIYEEHSLTNLPDLAFNSRRLEDNQPLSFYNIRHDSVVEVKGKQKGASIPVATVLKHSDSTMLTNTKANWQFDSEKGKTYISFPPITDKSQIPFYDKVTKQTYHQGVNGKDIYWINHYTGPSYERLKVHSYTLEPDYFQLRFMKGLYSACWATVQSDLPTTVYHICNLTEMSFSWFKEGMEFYTPAFVSTSKKTNLDWPGNCKWEITLNEGKRDHVADVKMMSQHPDEDEILISCCTRFRVVSKCTTPSFDPHYDYYICMEYLDL